MQNLAKTQANLFEISNGATRENNIRTTYVGDKVYLSAIDIIKEFIDTPNARKYWCVFKK